MPLFLIEQIKNISNYVLCSHSIILNCNDYMFNELNKINLPNNVYINPEIINKKNFHGTITKGIVSNMYYANQIFIYKYFVVLSGRTIFYTNITLQHLDILTKKWENLEQREIKIKGQFNNNDWQWPKFRNTLLAKHYLQNNCLLYGSEHEGLCFSNNVVNNILFFLTII